jgi:hypothetical protein
VGLEQKHHLGENPDQPHQIPRLSDGVFGGLVFLGIFIIDVHVFPLFINIPKYYTGYRRKKQEIVEKKRDLYLYIALQNDKNML